WQDIFITNDQMPNFLFHNNRDGTFREIGYSAGVAVGIDGQFEAGMGTDAADTTGSGRSDLIVTHLDQQLARLYQNVGEGYFEDAEDLRNITSNHAQAAHILRNDGGNANHWFQLLLIGTRSNRAAVGARVKVTAGDLVLYDEKKGGMSYQSAQDPRLHFGLGQ